VALDQAAERGIGHARHWGERDRMLDFDGDPDHRPLLASRPHLLEHLLVGVVLPFDQGLRAEFRQEFLGLRTRRES
jgi:hypothetical protein